MANRAIIKYHKYLENATVIDTCNFGILVFVDKNDEPKKEEALEND